MDCGCGGGSDCITKNKKQFKKWVKAELKRLDCGCGCKGVKKFEEKYGKLVGGKLKDCPPGWRNDGLTCVENCNPDERDDGLTCRKKCEPGWIDDGLTCRKPITSAIDPCPPGSRDIIGTCWGNVREDCIDDCFLHPAPGLRLYECGRLKGLIGDDWGPKMCTDGSLRCGQTCWGIDGITRQLHERNLKLSGGEVILQAIRGKRIEGRVDWEATFKEIENGMKDVFGNDSALAMLFDPNKNGVNDAFRKFGEDTQAAFEEVGRKTKDAFDKMGAEAKAAFEQFARDAEGGLTQLLGKEFMDKMKDPEFWIEAAAIFAQVGATVLGVLVTAGTLGMGAAAGAALIMAANMAGPAIRMIGKAAMGKPIDALDIVDMALSAIPAPGPGKAASSLIGKAVQTVVRNASTIKTIGGLVVSGVKAGQALGLIGTSCLGPNCPPPDPPLEDLPPPDPYEGPPKPPKDPPPAGQLSDDEISNLAPPCTFKTYVKIDGVKTKNANYIPQITWINNYRKEKYGTPIPGPAGALVDTEVTVPPLPPGPTTEPETLPAPETLEGEEGEYEVPTFEDDEYEVPTFEDDGEVPTFEEDGPPDEYEVPTFEEEAPAEGEAPEDAVAAPATVQKPVSEMTDDEILDLAPPFTFKRKITVDGKKIDNPNYTPESIWIKNYREKPEAVIEVPAEAPEAAEAVDEYEVPTFDEEEAPEGYEVPTFDEDGEAPAGYEVPTFDEDGEAPEGYEVPTFDEEVLDEYEVPTFEDEVPAEETEGYEIPTFEEEAPADEYEVPMFEDETQTVQVPEVKPGYTFEPFGAQDSCQRFQEDDILIGGAEELEIAIDDFGNVENPFGFMTSTIPKDTIPKTHQGNEFVIDCYMAKNPEIAKASGNDPDKITSHWIEKGYKEGLDADCGASNTSIEQRLQMLIDRENARVELLGRKTGCAAANSFWMEEEKKCDRSRDTKGKEKKELTDCRDRNGYWEKFSEKPFCNTYKDPEGELKPMKVWGNEKGFYVDPKDGRVDFRKAVDGEPFNLVGLCNAFNTTFWSKWKEGDLEYGFNPYASGGFNDEGCDASKDRNGDPVNNAEQVCTEDLLGNYRDGTCYTNNYPDGQPKPKEIIDNYNMPYWGLEGQLPKQKGVDFYFRQIAADQKEKFFAVREAKAKQEEAQDWEKAKLIFREYLGLVSPRYVAWKAKLSNVQLIDDKGESLKWDWFTKKDGSQLTNQDVENGVPIETYDNLTPEQLKAIKWRWLRGEFRVEGVPGGFLGPNREHLPKNPVFDKFFWSYDKEKRNEFFKIFNEISGSGKPKSLTLYWAEWCPHCHEMMPEWKKLKFPGVQIEAIEESESSIKVPGYPTIIFRDGKKMEKYNGPRTASHLKKFLKNKLSKK